MVHGGPAAMAGRFVALTVCALLAHSLAVVPAQADERACAKIVDPAARLACYDRENPPAARANETVAAPAVPAAVIPPPVSVADAPVVDAPARGPAPQTAIDDAARERDALPIARRIEPAAPVAPQASDAQAAPVPAAAGNDDSDGGLFGLRLNGLFDAPMSSAIEGDRLESTVAAVRRPRQQNMAFRLANEQIWIQNAPRAVPIRAGDKVTIRRGLFGGYMMENEDGATTRVSRVK